VGSVLLFVFVVSLGTWGEMLGRLTLRAVGSGRPQDWQGVGLALLSPLPPIAALSLLA
jgi:hypothetical protein